MNPICWLFGHKMSSDNSGDWSWCTRWSCRHTEPPPIIPMAPEDLSSKHILPFPVRPIYSGTAIPPVPQPPPQLITSPWCARCSAYHPTSQKHYDDAGEEALDVVGAAIVGTVVNELLHTTVDDAIDHILLDEPKPFESGGGESGGAGASGDWSSKPEDDGVTDTQETTTDDRDTSSSSSTDDN